MQKNKVKENNREAQDWLDYYKDELPINRLTMAKQIVLQRAMWMTEYYNKNKQESRGKLL